MSVLRLRCDHFVVYHSDTPLERACVSSARMMKTSIK